MGQDVGKLEENVPQFNTNAVPLMGLDLHGKAIDDLNLEYSLSEFSSEVVELNLAQNLLTQVSDRLIEFASNVKILDLSDNHILLLPPSISLLSCHLQELYLVHNHLTTLPDSLSQLTNLNLLALTSNDLTFPDDSPILQLTSLETLWLSYNRITALPEALFTNLTRLRKLSCAYNELAHISASIGALRCLEKLVVKSNQLKSLPGEIMRLPNLKVLEANNNCYHEKSLLIALTRTTPETTPPMVLPLAEICLRSLESTKRLDLAVLPLLLEASIGQNRGQCLQCGHPYLTYSAQFITMQAFKDNHCAFLHRMCSWKCCYVFVGTASGVGLPYALPNYTG